MTTWPGEGTPPAGAELRKGFCGTPREGGRGYPAWGAELAALLCAGFPLKPPESSTSPLCGPSTWDASRFNKLPNALSQVAVAFELSSASPPLPAPQPSQPVLWDPPAPGFVARALLALPRNRHLFWKGVISLWATSSFFYFDNLPRAQLPTWRWQRSVLHVKRLVYCCCLLSASAHWAPEDTPPHTHTLPALHLRRGSPPVSPHKRASPS